VKKKGSAMYITDSDDFEGDMVAMFDTLRRRGLEGAAIGLWVDLLGTPISHASEGGERDDHPEVARMAERDLAAACRITEMLWDEHKRGELSCVDGLPEAESDEDDLILTRIENEKRGDALDAEELLQEMALVASGEIHGRLDRGFPSSDLPRFAGVIRKAINEGLLAVHIDVETGEYLHPAD
jgi:hypothetical protein